MPALNFILQLLEVLDRNDSTLETSFFQLKVQTFNDFFHFKPALILCEAAVLPNARRQPRRASADLVSTAKL